MRLDRALAGKGGVSRRQARLWIASGRVLLAGCPCRILTKPLCAGQKVTLLADAAAGHAPMPLVPDILYQDNSIVVINKPSGLLSEHDRFGAPAVEGLLSTMLPWRRRERCVWLVHRLDAGTSGLMVLARTPSAAATLSDAFRLHQVEKTYLALCQGDLPQAPARLIDAPIARLQGTRHGVVAGGRAAQTEIHREAGNGGVTLVRALPKSGRTHQIRVHLAHLGLPLLGDRLYGGPGYLTGTGAVEGSGDCRGTDADTGAGSGRGDRTGTGKRFMQHSLPIARTMLHAWRLAFAHPVDGRAMCFEQPLAVDMAQLVDKCFIASKR